MSRILSNRTAVVSGASSGIGAATARALAADGARVALLARRTERIDALAQEIKEAGGEAISVAADVTSAASIVAAARQVKETFGNVDILVNNAGVAQPGPLADAPTDHWEGEVDVNLKGLLRTSQAFLPDLFAAARDGKAADVVSISSIGAFVAFPNMSVYTATKAAVSHLGASLRAELGSQGVRVSTIEPGVVDTEIFELMENDALRDGLDQFRQGYQGLAGEDIAASIVFAVSRPRHVNIGRITVWPAGQP